MNSLVCYRMAYQLVRWLTSEWRDVGSVIWRLYAERIYWDLSKLVNDYRNAKGYAFMYGSTFSVTRFTFIIYGPVVCSICRELKAANCSIEYSCRKELYDLHICDDCVKVYVGWNLLK